MKKIIILISFMLFSFQTFANDIYITQSGNNLNLDILQDGQNNVAGTSGTAIQLTGNSMTFNIDQVGNSNVVSTVINGNSYSGNIDLTGNSNTVALTCDSGGSNCETVQMSIDATSSGANITVNIGTSADSQEFIGTLDLTSTNTDTIVLTVNAAKSDMDIDITNNALGSSAGVTGNFTQTGDGDISGHSMKHGHTGEGATIDILQSGIYDNKIDMTTSGTGADIDIIQRD